MWVKSPIPPNKWNDAGYNDLVCSAALQAAVLAELGGDVAKRGGVNFLSWFYSWKAHLVVLAPSGHLVSPGLNSVLPALLVLTERVAWGFPCFPWESVSQPNRLHCQEVFFDYALIMGVKFLSLGWPEPASVQVPSLHTLPAACRLLLWCFCRPVSAAGSWTLSLVPFLEAAAEVWSWHYTSRAWVVIWDGVGCHLSPGVGFQESSEWIQAEAAFVCDSTLGRAKPKKPVTAQLSTAIITLLSNLGVQVRLQYIPAV